MTATTFRLFINTDGAAFGETEEDRALETARILREVAERVEAGDISWLYRTLYDLNGNDCGRAAFKDSEEAEA